MRKPAARIGDTHTCPMATPGSPPVPHIGGPVVGPGCVTVFIEGQPAATTGDQCICEGEPDTIVEGSSGVYIGGKPAVRMGDSCAHGGVVTSGCATVLIGGSTVRLEVNVDLYKGPFTEEKIRIIDRAIQECITLLERKLALMENNDPGARDDFKKWFGREDDGAVEIILNRIQRALALIKSITIENFKVIENERLRRGTFAIVCSWDEFHDFYLGDLFWNENYNSDQMNGMVLVHELSHFEDVGNTDDFDYESPQCIYLAENYPDRALYNAESFMYFIKA